jgi:hypothetical protein
MRHYLSPQNIRTDYNGYLEFVRLYHNLKEYENADIIIDFSCVKWFEANLCAILGAIEAILKAKNVNVTYENLSPGINNILCRNGFIGNYPIFNRDCSTDTVVTFQRFEPHQDSAFNEYILRELLSKSDFPRHSELLGKRISESIFEIFENARTHGKCDYIHTCGQYYPRKTPARLDITIVDIGKTIHKNVNDYLSSKLQAFSASEAIAWAVEYGNTTKINRTGGLGLSLILEFIQKNDGVIQIISSNGMWEYKKKNIKMHLLPYPFPGTIVNIEFNFADSNYYKLKNESNLTINDIF